MRSHGIFGLYIKVAFRDLSIFPITKLPQDSSKRIGIVSQGQRFRTNAGHAALSMRVVEISAPHSHRHISSPAVQMRGVHNASQAAHNKRQIFVIDRIACVIRRRVELAQLGCRPLEFLLHGLEQNTVLAWGGTVVRALNYADRKQNQQKSQRTTKSFHTESGQV